MEPLRNFNPGIGNRFQKSWFQFFVSGSTQKPPLAVVKPKKAGGMRCLLELFRTMNPRAQTKFLLSLKDSNGSSKKQFFLSSWLKYKSQPTCGMHPLCAKDIFCYVNGSQIDFNCSTIGFPLENLKLGRIGSNRKLDGHFPLYDKAHTPQQNRNLRATFFLPILAGRAVSRLCFWLLFRFQHFDEDILLRGNQH